MKQIIFACLLVVLLGISMSSCREKKSTSEKIENGIEEIGEGIEEGLEDVEDAIEDIVDDN